MKQEFRVSARKIRCKRVRKRASQRHTLRKRMLGAVLAALPAWLAVQGLRCRAAVEKSRRRLAGYGAKTIALSHGCMTYVDAGEGEVILSVHGIFGGYDQAFETCRDFSSDHRIIAPSRFGYLGSDIRHEGSPAQQAKAFAELLDRLGIEKAYVLGTSAGGSVAIRFALDYPDRTKGLILYCSAMPFSEEPESYAEYAGPPKLLCNDFSMFLLSPLFEQIMGMDPATIHTMLPVSARRRGVLLDASMTNPDMARNFGSYTIESLEMRTLIFHAKDDKLVKYEDTGRALRRFPDCTFVPFETGGHLMVGHSQDIREAMVRFMR